MSEKTLNSLIKLFLLVTIGIFLVLTLDIVSDAISIKYIKYIKYLFMVAFGVTPVLLILKVISRLFLSGLKGQSIQFIENMFVLYYFLLTKEARKEWADYIDEQKRKSI